MPERITSPLAGKRVVITRGALANAELTAELHKRSAVPIHIPLISFADPHDYAPLDDAIAKLDTFEWVIFTSAEAVRRFVGRVRKAGILLGGISFSGKIAAVGPGTAKAANENGMTVNFVAEQNNGVALANELGRRVQRQTVLLPRSDRANPDLPGALRDNGAVVKEVIAYRTLPPTDIDIDKIEQVFRGEVDAILFFSPSAVEHFDAISGKRGFTSLPHRTVVLAIGSVTATALRNAGAQQILAPPEPSVSKVIAALEEHCASSMKALDRGAQVR